MHYFPAIVLPPSLTGYTFSCLKLIQILEWKSIMLMAEILQRNSTLLIPLRKDISSLITQ